VSLHKSLRSLGTAARPDGRRKASISTLNLPRKPLLLQTFSREKVADSLP
jgi:hypothetical protein